MAIIEALFVGGYIASKLYDGYKGICKVSCPNCGTKYTLEDGLYVCEKCSKVFRKIGKKTYNSEEITTPLQDYIAVLYTQCAKSDCRISQNEKDFIIDYLYNNFDLNQKQKKYISQVCNNSREIEYSDEIFKEINKVIKELGSDYYEWSLEILCGIMFIFFIDNNYLSEKQNMIIQDCLLNLNINISDYDNVKQYVLEQMNLNNQGYSIGNEDYSKYYDILGLKPGCSKDDLKKARREKMKIYHPDRYNNMDLPKEIKDDIEFKMKEINKAYDVLLKLYE